MYLFKPLYTSLLIALVLLGCNATEEGSSDKNTTKSKTTSKEKSHHAVLFFAKEGNASTITIPLDQNDKKFQEELKAFYEKYFLDQLEKALASSQNLHNPTFDPLIEAFPFAVRSTSFYKKAKEELGKKGYSIKNEVSFEKFHTFSENGSYYFNFSPAWLEASLGVKENSNSEPYQCEEIIDVKLAPYFTKRNHHFIKYNECMSEEDKSIVVNSKTNKSVKLEGFGTAIKKFTFEGKEILLITSHMGAHTDGVSFFSVEKNGDLRLMKNGFMVSDKTGDPEVTINKSIEVKTRYYKDKYKEDKSCRYFIEDTFSYDNKKREFIKAKSKSELVKDECHEI